MDNLGSMPVPEQWWKRACEENPHAIAFVDLEDKFLYVNKAWCKLCGWSASSLINQKRWQDITINEDVGGDQAATEEIKAGTQDEYYLEKEYISPLGAKRPVGLYVYRHPPFGPQEGYIVFGIPKEGREQEALRQAYSEVRNSVALISEQQKGFRKCEARISHVESKTNSIETKIASIQENQNRILSILDRLMLDKESGNITVTNSESVGGDKTTNSQTLLIVVAVTLLGTVTLLAGGKFMLDYVTKKVLIESQQNRPPAIEVDINE